MPLYRQDEDELSAIQAQLTAIGYQVAEILAIVSPPPPPPPPPAETTPTLQSYTPTGLNPSPGTSWATKLDLLHDGDPTAAYLSAQKGSGLIADSNSFAIKLVFQSPITIKKLRVFGGQYNGPFNMPQSLRLYRGEDTANLVFASSAPISTDQDFTDYDLATNQTSSTVYRLDLTGPNSGYVSLWELQVLGIIG